MGKKETLTSSSLFRVYVVQIESHPFITVGAIELSREPFIPLNGSGMIMERLAKTMDIGGVAKEIGSRYIQWHDQRHRAVMNWIENHMKTKRNTDKKLHHFVVFPEGGIGRHQLKELQRFVKKMQNEDIVLVHRQVESTVSWLTKFEGILHGNFAASCGEGFSHSAKVGMEGSRSS